MKRLLLKLPKPQKRDFILFNQRWKGMDVFCFECLNAWLFGLWGTVLLIFGEKAFYTAKSFAVMNTIGDAHRWGYVAVCLSLVKVYGLLMNVIAIRKYSVFVGMTLWFLTAISLLFAGSYTGPIMYGTLAVFDYVAFIRLAKLKALIENY